MAGTTYLPSPSIIVADSVGSVPLTIQLLAGQSGDALDVKNSSGAVIASIGSTGVLGVSGLNPLTAGGSALGSAALPWSGVYLGNAATNNILLTGTATAGRTATLPDNTGTLAELNFAQTWSATQTFAVGTLAINPGPLTLASAASAARTATFPDNTGTVAEINLAQVWSAVQTFGAGFLLLNPGPLTFASSASAARTVTFPDNTGTVAELNLAQTWTAIQTMSANFLFSADNTFDIGASGATRPRDLFLGRNFTSPKTITGNVNNTFYLDGTKYAQTTAGLQAALADAVTQNGGRVVVPSGAAFSITSQIVVGDAAQSNKVPIVLEIQPGAVLTIGALGAGVDAFIIGDNCGVLGSAGVSPASAAVVSPSILLNASSTCNSVFAPISRTGSQEGFFIQGINVQGNASATITSAVFDVQGVFVGTRIRDITTSTIPSKNLRVRPGTGSIKTASDIVFDNCNFDCSGTTGGIPVSIENIAASNIANLTFLGGAIQHAGASQKLLNIDGLGVASGVTNLQFLGTHFEISSGVTQPTNAVTIADALEVTFHSCAFSGNNGVTSLFNISQTGAGLCRDITIKNIHASGTFTNFINNSVNAITIPQGGAFGNDIYEYSYGGASGAADASISRKISDNTNLFVQSKAYATTGDLTQGGIHLVPISNANGQMTAITSAAAAGGAYGNGGASQVEAGIYFEGSGAFGTKLHLATTDSFAAGAKFRWQISPAGHLLAEVDNTVDIGASAATRPRDLFLGRDLRVGGLVKAYNGITTVSFGMPAIYGSVDSSSTANIGTTLLYTTPTTGSPLVYSISIFIQVTAAAGTSSTLPSVVITWTDGNTSTAQTFTATPTNTGNTLTTFQQATVTIKAASATAINYSTTGYASSPAGMGYNVSIRVTQL